MKSKIQNLKFKIQNSYIQERSNILAVLGLALFILGLICGGLIGERTTKQFFMENGRWKMEERGKENDHRIDNRAFHWGIYRDDDYGNTGIIEEQQGGRGR